MLATDLRRALDPVAFAVDGLGFTPDPWQAAVLRSSARRLLLNCCRQSGKSTVAAIRALHCGIHQPGALVLLISPSLRQSSELFKKVRVFADALPLRLALEEDNRLSMQLGNGSRIVSLPGSEATVRGFSSVDLLIHDEASRVSDALYAATRPFLAVSGGTLITMSTPAGKRGWWYDAWVHGGDVWKRIEVPASQCPHIDPTFLAEERAALGRLYAQEYECGFLEAEDNVFLADQIDAAFSDAVRPLFGDRG